MLLRKDKNIKHIVFGKKLFESHPNSILKTHEPTDPSIGNKVEVRVSITLINNVNIPILIKLKPIEESDEQFSSLFRKW